VAARAGKMPVGWGERWRQIQIAIVKGFLNLSSFYRYFSIFIE